MKRPSRKTHHSHTQTNKSLAPFSSLTSVSATFVQMHQPVHGWWFLLNLEISKIHRHRAPSAWTKQHVSSDFITTIRMGVNCMRLPNRSEYCCPGRWAVSLIWVCRFVFAPSAIVQNSRRSLHSRDSPLQHRLHTHWCVDWHCWRRLPGVGFLHCTPCHRQPSIWFGCRGCRAASPIDKSTEHLQHADN